MCVPDTFALSKLGRSPGPAGAQARAVWETRGARDAPAGRPRSAASLKSSALEVKTLMQGSSVLI